MPTGRFDGDPGDKAAGREREYKQDSRWKVEADEVHLPEGAKVRLRWWHPSLNEEEEDRNSSHLANSEGDMDRGAEEASSIFSALSKNLLLVIQNL